MLQLSRQFLFTSLFAASSFSIVVGDEPAKDTTKNGDSVEQLADKVKQSIVVINVPGREKGEEGIGTGFVVSDDGLIVTNLHVIGEGRPIIVQTHDRTRLEVVSVHASDRYQDLAIIRVSVKDKPLVPLPLADDGAAKDGMSVVVMGNPLGLRYSVVSGVVSGKRELDGRQMLQLAIPIEPGNSGGPVVDMQGRVHGIVTMKSLRTNNLGFAVAVDALKPLLEKPNPVPFDRWLRIGRLDEDHWKPLFGALWQQRGGRIFVEGQGKGFGGRSLCVYQDAPPEIPFEVAVNVRLDDEAGAAGLVFHSDSGNKHYGFYPSNGKLRLSRFEGSDVFSWRVLRELESEHYQPGSWNQIKVRVEKERLLCYVNDHLLINSTDRGFTTGKVGLAKFRQTVAEFKEFQLSPKIASREKDSKQTDKLAKIIDQLPGIEKMEASDLDELADYADDSAELLLKRSDDLKRQAEQMQLIAADVRTRAIVDELRQQVNKDANNFDLLRAALTIARLDGEDIDSDAYIEQVDRMAKEIWESVEKDADDQARLKAVDKYLFVENGFHGSRFDYYHRANSYINRVIDDRVGLPIAISLLYMELAERMKLNVVGVGLPGHFVVKLVPSEGDEQLIDAFEEAKRLTRDDAAKLVKDFAGREIQPDDLKPSDHKSIVLRMLHNLRSLAEKKPDREAILRYLEAMIAIEPNSISERGMRAMIRFETGRRSAAIADLNWFLENEPAGIDVERIREMREYFLHQKPPRR